MQRYYQTVMMLRELNDVLTQQLSDTIKGTSGTKLQILNERFQLRDGQLETTHPTVFEEPLQHYWKYLCFMPATPKLKLLPPIRLDKFVNTVI